AKLNSLYLAVREAAGQFNPARVATEARSTAEEARVDVGELCKFLDHVLLPQHDPMVATAPRPVRWDELLRIGRPMLERLERASSELWKLILAREQEETSQGESRTALRNIQETEYCCNSLQRATSGLVDFCESYEAVLANRPALLLMGDAGQPARPGRKEYEQPQRRLWYIVRSYLVRRSDTGKFYSWAKRQDFMDRRMPEPGHICHIHLGEHAWVPAYREGYPSEGWTRGSFEEIPVEVIVTSIDFLYESSGFDCSIDDTIRITLPAAPLVREMSLHGIASEGQFVDPTGQVVAFDPSVRSPGPGALLVRREALKRHLADKGLD